MSAPNLTTLVSAPNPPRVLADGAVGLAAASRTASAAPARVAEARGARLLEVSALPYLRSSPEGAVFLKSAFPRALARGAPAEFCPAAAASPPGVETAGAAASEALSGCLALLASRGADEECACRVLALNGALLAPQSAFGFATGVSAHLIFGRRPAVELIADSALDEAGRETLVFRTAAGEVGRARLSRDAAELRFSDAPDRVFSGQRQPFGYRRGRLAERLALSAPDGERLTVLIGVERRDAAPARN